MLAHNTYQQLLDDTKICQHVDHDEHRHVLPVSVTPSWFTNLKSTSEIDETKQRMNEGRNPSRPNKQIAICIVVCLFLSLFLIQIWKCSKEVHSCKKKRIEVQKRKKIDNDHLCKSWFRSSCSGGVLLRRSVLLGSRTTVTGMFWTSWLQTSHVRFPLMPNHLNAHSLCANAISPRQLHSIFKISPYSSVSESIHILHTASSSGISPSSCSSSPTFLWHKFSTHHQIAFTGLL